MSHRYLNLVLHDFNSYIFSVCRIDLCKHLFYGSSEIARAAGEKKAKRGVIVDGWEKLPPAAINFQPTPNSLSWRTFSVFSLLGDDEGNILYIDPRPQTALYNFDMRLVQSIPSPHSTKDCTAISLPVTRADPIDPMKKRLSLYFLDLSYRHDDENYRCFEVLSYRNKQWRWDILPPPPFFLRDPDNAPQSQLYSYAVVDPSTICISSLEQERIGTYTFDTVRRRWRRAADWVLPFFGKAEYVPELNLWFGLSAWNPFSSLCAVDLSAMDSAQPPIPQHTMEYLHLPEDMAWSPTQLHMVNLGSGRFCVAAFFGMALRNCQCPPDEYSSDEDTDGKEYVVFTGLEIKRSDDGDGSLELIKHMSKGYVVGCRNIECVL
ncbi:unnamed protein product [Alopecurus aequalis]